MSEKFDIKYKLLLPEIQIKLWILALDVNTSRVNLAYKSGNFASAIAYNYGGNVQASMSIRRFNGSFGVSPKNGAVDLGLAYRGFNFGTSANFTDKRYGVNLSYGESLLPFPSELKDAFDSAGVGLHSVVKQIDRYPNDPLKWYNIRSEDAAAISKAIKAGQMIQKYGRKDPLGIGLRLSHDPQYGLVIYGGLQTRF